MAYTFTLHLEDRAGPPSWVTEADLAENVAAESWARDQGAAQPGAPVLVAVRASRSPGGAGDGARRCNFSLLFGPVGVT